MLLYLLCLVLLLIYFTSFKEGFVSDQYDYLKPHDPAVLDDKTSNDFMTLFNQNVTSINPVYTLSKDSQLFQELKGFASIEEFQYYIQNKQWPLNSYLMQYVTQPDALTPLERTNIKTVDDLKKIIPARAVYEILLRKKESTQTPIPLTYDIYMGNQQPPTSSTSTSTSKSSPDEPDYSLSTDNYNKLKSVCSSI